MDNSKEAAIPRWATDTDPAILPMAQAIRSMSAGEWAERFARGATAGVAPTAQTAVAQVVARLRGPRHRPAAFRRLRRGRRGPRAVHGLRFASAEGGKDLRRRVIGG